MKKTFVLFLMFSLLWMPDMYAAGIPARQGIVTDEASLLTKQETAAIAAIAEGDRYTIQVLTVDSLDGAESGAYATDVYDSWDLTPRDVLLLISAGDQKVELNFNNPGLQGYINSWSQAQGGALDTAAITGLLDTYFNPYAREGDFAGGIRSMIQKLHSFGGTGSGATSGGGTVGTTDSGAAGRSSSSPGLLKMAGIVIGIALLAFMLYVLFTGLRRRGQLRSQQEQLAGLLVRANRALESLQPFQGIVQGKTGEMVEGISKRLSAQLVEISALQSSQSSQPPFYRLKALRAASSQLQQTETAFRSTLEEEEQRIAVISDADRNVKQQITELKKEAPELNLQLQSAVKETGYELQEIAGDLKELAEETAKADELELFDPIAAQDMTGEAQEKQAQIEQDLQDVDTYDDKLNGFPGILAAARSTIAAVIEQNSLHNMKVKPYENLEQASAAAATLEAPLRSGDMDEVRKIAARMDTLLGDAIAMTERQALIRQNNLRDLDTVRSRWSGLSQRRNELHSRIAEARSRFAEHHLAPLEEVLETAGTELRQGAGEVPQIETWTSDQRGEYDNARNSLDQLLKLQEETARKFDNAGESLDMLSQRLANVTRLLSEGQERVDAAQRRLQSKGIASISQFQLSLLPEYGELEQLLSLRPYNLDELEAAAHAYESQISSFVEEANRLIRQKEEEGRLAQLAILREQQRREEARKRTSSSGGFGGGRSSGGSSWGGGGRSSGGSSWGGGGGKSGGNSSGGSKW
ncbi:TPM domain-containing protein [Paenibacillus riograndensis]|uniref:Putative secreted protein n=1 Tax=Paenibacillus riograndensis SBR5 TaxID=1073571 RepID=A0A0E4H794_9BACL|nr:TPM domain-containing protein [Paenibacillus riograndensis]CQR51792.1 putative secreted protein [Paenibacillus riograndensis SBR5]